ncbi:hypothetical protein CRI94_05665 [Longibacter salinarum]|uniref:Uncharacterized protein n=1 Tax=Longibacter salinarum TaxID=1850348 RepID=A0A2A8D0M3_9BACT|nr:oligosaccharide flippase family protein [Longibacter salinarum]PEN14512.1 hypothetical protein CRI94_05665 [Longibacter salinarum]
MNSSTDSEPSLFDNKSLKKESVTGGLVSLAGQAGIFVLRLGSLAVLVRLVESEGFGLVAMAMTVITLLTDLGLTKATVRRSIDFSSLFRIEVMSHADAVVIAVSAAVLGYKLPHGVGSFARRRIVFEMRFGSYPVRRAAIEQTHFG